MKSLLIKFLSLHSQGYSINDIAKRSSLSNGRSNRSVPIERCDLHDKGYCYAQSESRCIVAGGILYFINE